MHKPEAQLRLLPLSGYGEWVIVVQCQMSNMSAISCWEQITFLWIIDDDVCCVPDQHAKLNFKSDCRLKQYSAGRHVSPLDILSWFQANPSFLLLLNAAWLVASSRYQYSLWYDPTSAPT